MLSLVLVSFILPYSVSMLPGLSQGYQSSPFHLIQVDLVLLPFLLPVPVPLPPKCEQWSVVHLARILPTYLRSVPVHIGIYMRTLQARRRGSGRRSTLMDMGVVGGISLTCIDSIARAASRRGNRNFGSGCEGQIVWCPGVCDIGSTV